MVKTISYIICFLMLYFYVFAPPFQFSPLGMDKPIMLFAYIYITYKNGWLDMYKKFKVEIHLLILLLSFSTMVYILTDFRDITMVMFDFGLLLYVIPCAYGVYLYIQQNKGFNLDSLLLTISVVAATISLYLILNPDTAYFMKTELMKYPEGLADMLIFRGFGFSDGLLFSYPVIIGICMGFILLGFHRQWIYYIFLLPMLVAIFTNARSGLVPVMAAVVILLFINTTRFVRLSTISVIAIMLLLGSLVVVVEQNDKLKMAYEWGMSSFDILGDLLQGKKSENIEILLSEDMQVYPESIDQWIIGSGKYILMGEWRSTDIGYLLRLNYGGVFYFIIMMAIPIYMFLRLRLINLPLALILIAPVLYYMMKSDFFVLTPSIRFFFLVYVIGILDHNSFTKKTQRNEKQLSHK